MRRMQFAACIARGWTAEVPSDEVGFVLVTSVTVRVPAKINLQLAVGPLRPDGYHGLVTVFHAVSLFDEVTVAPADDGQRDGQRRGRGPGPGERRQPGPAGRPGAARGASGACRVPPGPVTVADAPGGGGVAVTIAKRIPVAGGMAGGSADAAAALVACNELWGAGLSQAELCEVAAAVGSDVAFAVLGGTAVGRGRGEQLTPVLRRAARPTTGC